MSSTEMAIPTEAEVAARSTEQLRAELARGLSLTAEVLTRLALIWAELERRGEDLSDLRKGLGRSLPLIASGRLAAEAVVAFAGKPAVLRAIEGLPAAEQRRLAEGGTVRVVSPADRRQVEEMSASSLPAKLLRVVFADGEVRGVAEQRLLLGPKSEGKPGAAGRRYRVSFDPVKCAVRLGLMEVPLHEVLAAIGEGFAPERVLAHDLAPSDYATASAKLHPSEKEALRAFCEKSGVAEPALVRLALKACGLLSQKPDEEK